MKINCCVHRNLVIKDYKKSRTHTATESFKPQVILQNADRGQIWTKQEKISISVHPPNSQKLQIGCNFCRNKEKSSKVYTLPTRRNCNIGADLAESRKFRKKRTSSQNAEIAEGVQILLNQGKIFKSVHLVRVENFIRR